MLESIERPPTMEHRNAHPGLRTPNDGRFLKIARSIDSNDAISLTKINNFHIGHCPTQNNSFVTREESHHSVDLDRDALCKHEMLFIGHIKQKCPPTTRRE